MLQEVPFLPSLLLFAAALAGLCLSAAILTATVRRRWSDAARRARLLLTLAVAYLAAVMVISLFSSPRLLHPGDLQCFDDWCVTVRGTESELPIGSDHLVAVRFEVVSQAKRVTQAALGATAWLLDAEGRKYRFSGNWQKAWDQQHGNQHPLSDRLGPGESFQSVQLFEGPGAAARPLTVVIDHGGWPDYFIIGNSRSLLHPRTRFVLP